MSEPDQKNQNVSQFNKFLQNNQDFLQQKYDQYFKKSPLQLKQINRQAAIKYIYDIFSFQKYENDQKMNVSLQKSLLKNIEDHVSILAKRKATWNNKTAVELLKYCIENNQMFAVKYDKKDKRIKTQQMNESNLSQKQQNQPTNQQEVEKVEQAEQKEQSQKQEQKEVQNLQQHKSEQMDGKDENLINQFDQSKQKSPEKTADPELIKKNLKQMFQFYCKQQQNVGANTTFDRISYQCKTMTLGKFMAFATSTYIINEKIDKALLMRKFKLIAQGKKQIQFQNFYDVVKILATIDQALIPKLGVDEKVNFKNKLKQRAMAFNTKDQTFRQVKRDYIFVPKLTGHSGKLSDALYDEMKARKSMKIASSLNHHTRIIEHAQLNALSKLPDQNKRYENISRINALNQGSQIIASPAHLSSSHIRDFQEDLGFLQKMINAEQADQQWLKQYKLPLNLNIAKKSNISNAALPPRLMNRKQSIVPNLKKRVEQLQRTETRQTVHLQKRQMLNSKKQRERHSKSILN